MIRFASKLTLGSVLSCALALGACSGSTDAATGDDANVTQGPKFSVLAVVPELTWDFFVDDPEPIPGYLALEFSVGDAEDTGPVIAVGKKIYGAGGPTVRIADDLKLYLEFETDKYTELYCCMGTANPEQQANGIWGNPATDAEEIADVGKSGFYPLGYLEGITAEDLKHETVVDIAHVKLEGVRLANTRRIQRGDRQITFEAEVAPELVTTAPTLLADEAAVAAVIAEAN